MRRNYKYLYQTASIPYLPGTLRYADSTWYSDPVWTGERYGGVSSRPMGRRAGLRRRGPVTTERVHRSRVASRKTTPRTAAATSDPAPTTSRMKRRGERRGGSTALPMHAAANSRNDRAAAAEDAP